MVSDFGEDYGRWEGDRPFNGMRWLFRVRDADTNEVMWGWSPLDDNGCTEVFYDDALPSPGLTDVIIERMRWTISPEGHSILGYECELDDSDPTMAQGPDGECNSLVQSDLVQLAIGSSSTNCGGTATTADHCTLQTLQGLDLEPIDYNLWSITSADSRTNFNDPTEVYLLQETDTGNAKGSSAGPHMGRHPCVRFKYNQWHAKFIPAHEYGHLTFFDISNEQGMHPTVYEGASDIDYGPGGQHSIDSAEWNAAAAIEGFADAAMLAAWNDLGEDDDVYFVNVWQSGSGGATPTLLIYPTAGPTPCTPAGCGPGESNERNWGIALRQFLRPAAPATLQTVAEMLSTVHGATWHPNGADNAFGNEFDGTMNAWLSGSLYNKWAALAAYYNLYEVDP